MFFSRRFVMMTVFFAGLVALSTACALVLPELEVLSQNIRTEVVKDANGEDDWAYVLDVSVRNRGAAGKVRAKAKITTSAGQQYYRELEVAFERDEAKKLQFVFNEPSFVGDILTAIADEAPKVTQEFTYDVLP
jgi:hypothetical protein